MDANISNEPKTATFQMRINPDFKTAVEQLFADCGMTLPEAINIFLKMSLNANGLPFEVKRRNTVVLDDRSVDILESQYQKGLASVKDDSDWITIKQARSAFGKDE